MILDSLNEMCSAESVAATAGTALVGDVIDLGAAPADFGVIEPLYVVIRPTTEIITAGTAGTIKFQLASDAQAAIAADGTATIHIDTGTFVTDDAAANDDEMNIGGDILIARLPAGTYERYLGILVTVATTTVSAGAIDAFITADVTKWKAYADATN